MYNLDYIEKQLRQNSGTAEYINRIRWEFVCQAIDVKDVLDYGSGVGWFRAFRPDGVNVDSYDVNKFSPMTGVKLDKYDVVTMWDVLEHLPNFNPIDILKDKTDYFALTVPLLPEGQHIQTWRHYKPGEHLHVFKKSDVIKIFFDRGFKLVEFNYKECPPRKDIGSFLFEKMVR